MEGMEDSPDFWSGPVQSCNSPVKHRFLIGLDWSTNGPLPDCDCKYVSVRTMHPGLRPPLGDPKSLHSRSSQTLFHYSLEQFHHKSLGMYSSGPLSLMKKKHYFSSPALLLSGG